MNTLSAVRRLTLFVSILGFVLVACRCSFAIASECALNVRDMVLSANENSFTDCGEYVSLVCPDADPTVPGAVEAELACISQAADAWMYGGQNAPVPDYPTRQASIGVLSAEAPEGMSGFEQPPANACDGFAILTPNDGLANGLNVFTWSRPNLPLIEYRLMVYDENGNLLISWDLPLYGEIINVDLSQGYIGGAYQLTIVLEAYRFANHARQELVCTTSRTYLREATDPGVPPADLTPVIEPTPEPPR